MPTNAGAGNTCQAPYNVGTKLVYPNPSNAGTRIALQIPTNAGARNVCQAQPKLGWCRPRGRRLEPAKPGVAQLSTSGSTHHVQDNVVEVEEEDRKVSISPPSDGKVDFDAAKVLKTGPFRMWTGRR